MALGSQTSETMSRGADVPQLLSQTSDAQKSIQTLVSPTVVIYHLQESSDTSQDNQKLLRAGFAAKTFKVGGAGWSSHSKSHVIGQPEHHGAMAYLGLRSLYIPFGNLT